MLYDFGELDILGCLKYRLRERLREIFYRREIVATREGARKLLLLRKERLKKYATKSAKTTE